MHFPAIVTSSRFPVLLYLSCPIFVMPPRSHRKKEAKSWKEPINFRRDTAGDDDDDEEENVAV